MFLKNKSLLCSLKKRLKILSLKYLYTTVVTFQNIFINFSRNFFFKFRKMSKHSSDRYYKITKKDYKKAPERYQTLSKEEKTTKWLWKIQKFLRRWTTKTDWV